MTCIPIRDLKDTSNISQMCHAANEPISNPNNVGRHHSVITTSY